MLRDYDGPYERKKRYNSQMEEKRNLLKEILERKSTAERLRELKEETKAEKAEKIINRLLNDSELMDEFNKQMRAHKINKINEK